MSNRIEPVKKKYKRKYKKFSFILFLIFALKFTSVQGQSLPPFSSTTLNNKRDLSSLMVEGIDSFLIIETNRLKNARKTVWQRDFSSADAFNKSINPQRELLSQRLGVVDARAKPEMEVLTNGKFRNFTIETNTCTINAVRWKVLDGKYKGLSSEGLLLQPKGKVIARVVIVPDADILPEVYAGIQKTGDSGYNLARRLAESGWEVIIPLLVNREDTFSGNELVDRFTNQPHREWIYRQGFVVGRHIIGYELQKILAAVDWMKEQNKVKKNDVSIGIIGYGEGGLLALNAAALDPRISSALVSGYFDAREQLWSEPIYRNVFGLLKYFGDAELAVMTWPRRLVIEHAKGPELSGPPSASKKRSGAAPGLLTTPNISTAKLEWDRAKAILPKKSTNLLWRANENNAFKPLSTNSLIDFAKGLNVNLSEKLITPITPLKENSEWLDFVKRQKRTVQDMEYHIQRILSLSENTRNQNFWETLNGDTTAQRPIKATHRKHFWDVIGRLPAPSIPANPKARILQETDKWTSYEIMLDVWPEVFAWGILIIPKDIKLGEELPAVVCQHGLEALPADVVTTDPKAKKFKTYQGFATRLAERGYVTFSPHNPYRGEDKFRVLQRKANPLGLSLFSIITGQHQRIVEWLGKQSFIDAKRIGFYGLSYGGKTAMRIPPLVENYALSICSGDFNEWVRKIASIDYRYNYIFTKEYEMPEWNLGHTFNYAEMASLIAPRPFMVEFGHFDEIATDEWVGYEFAKVRQHYDLLGIPKSVNIEYFNGPHMINSTGTFEFLDRHLKPN